MSVTDLDKVDAIGLTEEGKRLYMRITDHLGWDEELIHLEILQDKINAYVAYLEGGEWKSRYPEDLEGATIEIVFLYEITDNCQKFLQVVQDQLGQECIEIKATIMDDASRKRSEEKTRANEEPKKKRGFRFPFFGKGKK